MSEWIPMTKREMTDEEKQEYINIGQTEMAEYGEILYCPLPDDGQEVLITVNGYVCVDVFYHDGFECDFEGVNIEDVTAWMPLPKPYVPDTNIGKMSASPTGAEGSDKE